MVDACQDFHSWVPQEWSFEITVPLDDVNPEVVRVLCGFDDDLNYLWDTRD